MIVPELILDQVFSKIGLLQYFVLFEVLYDCTRALISIHLYVYSHRFYKNIFKNYKINYYKMYFQRYD